MTCLVDANVLSEATKPAPDSKAIEWLRRNERELVVDPISLGEIRSGQALPIKDSLIAATALVHGYIAVTRNTRDFKKAGVEVLDPFA